MQNRHYKINKIYTFIKENLRKSKKSNTFATSIKNKCTKVYLTYSRLDYIHKSKSPAKLQKII